MEKVLGTIESCEKPIAVSDQAQSPLSQKQESNDSDLELKKKIVQELSSILNKMLDSKYGVFFVSSIIVLLIIVAYLIIRHKLKKDDDTKFPEIKSLNLIFDTKFDLVMESIENLSSKLGSSSNDIKRELVSLRSKKMSGDVLVNYLEVILKNILLEFIVEFSETLEKMKFKTVQVSGNPLQQLVLGNIDRSNLRTKLSHLKVQSLEGLKDSVEIDVFPKIESLLAGYQDFLFNAAIQQISLVTKSAGKQSGVTMLLRDQKQAISVLVSTFA